MINGIKIEGEESELDDELKLMEIVKKIRWGDLNLSNLKKDEETDDDAAFRLFIDFALSIENQFKIMLIGKGISKEEATRIINLVRNKLNKY